jgi:hypothetical protein
MIRKKVIIEMNTVMIEHISMSCHNNARQNCNIQDSKGILKKCSKTCEQQHQINITIIENKR